MFRSHGVFLPIRFFPYNEWTNRNTTALPNVQSAWDTRLGGGAQGAGGGGGLVSYVSGVLCFVFTVVYIIARP